MNPLRDLEKYGQSICLKLGRYQTLVDKRLEYWKEIDFLKRFWAKDATLWFPKTVPEITNRLGWLVLPEIMNEQLEDFISFAVKVKSEGIRHVILLGMGGSSLASEVFQTIFGNTKGYPELIVLDSTHPSAIRTVEMKIDLRHTLFIVSSKSGTTIETLSLFRYFWKKVGQIEKDRGSHFVAITDLGTPLMKMAQERGFRNIFQAPSDIGGRYSALTAFGILPASLIGMDVQKFLDRSWIMSENCSLSISLNETTSLVLAAALGELTKMGRDKVTFLTSPSISSFSLWLEQLIAESLGKDGKGTIPIVNEPITSSKNYAADRFFIYFYIEKDDNIELEELVKELEVKGHPIVCIKLTDKINLSQEIFSWEITVAAVGSVIGVHPFNQPDVQMAKDFAKNMMAKVEKGILNKKDVETISVEDSKALTKALKCWFGEAKEGDYIAIQAFLPPTPETTEALQKIRLVLLNNLQLATTSGYGPRFLHSTGQLHKGGPNTGLFIQLIDEPGEDLEVPETNYTFNNLIQVQALGDYQALKQLGRRVLRINLKRDVSGSLSKLFELISDNIQK